MSNESRKKTFENITKKYTARIFKMVYNMINDYEVTRDLTQDVFMKAWNAFDSFRGDASVYTWLYRIALNRVFQYRKKMAKSAKKISIDEIIPPDIDSNPEKNLFEKVDKQILRNTINELPEKYQSVLILRYYEDNDYRTISKILGIPIGTVRSRLHRGISYLGENIRRKI